MIILDINKDKLCNKKLVMRVNDKPKEKLIVQVLRDGQVDKWTGFFPTFYGLNAQDKKIMGTKVVRKTDYFEFTFPDNSFSAVGHFKRAYFELRDGDSILTTGDFEIEVINDIGIDKQEAEDIISLNDEIKKAIEDIKKEAVKQQTYLKNESIKQQKELKETAQKDANKALETSEKALEELEKIVKEQELYPGKDLEVVQSRGSFSSLKDRLDSYDIVSEKNNTIINNIKIVSEKNNTIINNIKYETEIEAIAHRGLGMVYPDTTVIGMKNCILLKEADSIELDIRVTKDEQLICIHDKEVDRTTNGTGKIVDITSDYVKTLDAGSKFSSVYKGAKIPSFATACSVVRGLPFKNFYPQSNANEIKDDVLRKKVIEETVSTIRNYGLVGKTRIQLAGLEFATEFRSYCPEITIALMCPPDINSANAYKKWAVKDGNAMIGADQSFWLAYPYYATELRNLGVGSFAWTITKIEQVEALRKANVFNIMTDVNIMGVK